MITMLALLVSSIFAYGPIALAPTETNAKDVPSRERIYPNKPASAPKPNPPPSPPSAPKMKLWKDLYRGDFKAVTSALMFGRCVPLDDKFSTHLKLAYLFYRMDRMDDCMHTLKDLDESIENYGRIDQYPDEGEE